MAGWQPGKQLMSTVKPYPKRFPNNKVSDSNNIPEILHLSFSGIVG
jgi:hypothetical protein